MTEWSEPVTMSAYDLLPDEDRKAIAWVREHGGLDEVEKRIMPEGMEWPKHTDGELVRIGGCWGEDGCDTSITYIERIIFAEDGVYLDNEYSEAFYRHGERVKRPAPKVLDADGVEIREGDVLYSVETGDYVVVGSIEPGNPWFATTDGALQHCAKFTHRAPVIAADGKPLRVGETVYGTRDLEPVEIVSLRSKEYDGVRSVKCKDRTGFVFYAPDDLIHQRPVLDADGVPIKKGDTVYVAPFDDPLTVRGFAADGRVLMDYHSDDSFGYSPENLTHAKPDLDTWERIEEDARLMPSEYTDRYRVGRIGFEEEDMRVDLVRRARKLAERGEL